MDINKLIKEKTEKILETELEEILTVNLKQAISSIFNDLIAGYNSEFKKILKNFVKSSFKLNLTNVKIETYNEMIMKIISNELNSFIKKEAATLIENRLVETLKFTNKTEYKLSEIVEIFAKCYWTDDVDEFEPTIIVEDNKHIKNYTYVYIDPEKNTKMYSCKYMFGIDDKGKVWRFINREERNGLPFNNDFETLLFSMYANATTVEIDDYETSWSRY